VQFHHFNAITHIRKTLKRLNMNNLTDYIFVSIIITKKKKKLKRSRFYIRKMHLKNHLYMQLTGYFRAPFGLFTHNIL